MPPVIDLDTISALIVEANPSMRTQLRNMLNMCGINKVQFAVTAGVAVRKLRDGRYDLILCEYHIGDGQDGQHLLEDLRHNAIIPLSTLFVMVTGERQYERVVSAAELAPNDYILKPFAADTLHDRVAEGDELHMDDVDFLDPEQADIWKTVQILLNKVIYADSYLEQELAVGNL